MFPTKKVEKILGISMEQECSDCSDWRGTLDQLKSLVACRAADLEHSQNESPTIGELIADLTPYGAKVQVEGYVIWPPREDACVSVDGFTVNSLTAEEVVDLLLQYRYADDCEHTVKGKKHTVWFWWD
jgi:hypothetical protein